MENLLCPYIEQQRLRWDLKEWALLPDWLTELIATRLHGKRITIERLGYGDLTPSTVNCDPTIWALYSELNTDSIHAAYNYDRIVTASKPGGEAAFALIYHSTGSQQLDEDGTPQAQLLIAGYLHPSTLTVGTVRKDRLPNEAQDPRLATVLSLSKLLQLQEPTAAQIAAIPTLLTNIARGSSPQDCVALLKIDVLPES
ncbi:MAG: hypothetical protein LBJ69_03215 [Holosporales bacterium]|jgi:hypothetical protein|nr:hypothetical protein [Holosporales bacterium]